MQKKQFETVRELIYFSYSNLAMAHSAVEKGQEKYSKLNFMIRSRLFKGLNNGTMNLRTIFDDEKVKLQTGQICNYCGSSEYLSLDHIFPKYNGGIDSADNLILSCRTCNSSKGKKDLMEWMEFRKEFIPLMIIRRYLKIVYNYCNDNGLLDKNLQEINGLELPFKIEFIPTIFPNPNELVLTNKVKNLLK